MPITGGEPPATAPRADRRTTVAIYLVIAALSLVALWPVVESQRLATEGQRALERGDHAAALAAWLPLAEDGDAAAQYGVGVLLERGLGTPEDPAAAAAWYRRAAVQGVEAAQVNLGLMLVQGRGVPVDDAEAVAWFRRAADHDIPEGLANLGQMHRLGRGVPRDPAQAYALLRKAALLGNVTAALGVADMLARGEGVAADAIEALAWAAYVAASDAPERPAGARLAAAREPGLDGGGRAEGARLTAQLERQLRR